MGGDAGEGVAGKSNAPQDDDSTAFDRRGFHRLVTRHARTKFLKGEYFSAVTECCKAFEELVQKKSRLAEDGADLMGRAFGPEGAFVVNLSGLKGKTRENMRDGLMHLCQGIVANVRNPVSHELDLKFRMRREDALDILGTTSYLCRQVERTRRGPGWGTGKGEKRIAEGAAAGSHRAPRGGSGSGDPARRDGVEGGRIDGLEASPELVGQGDPISVTVTGRGIDGWHAGVFTEDVVVKLCPTRLEAFGQPESLGGGMSRYSFLVKTLGYRWGEYRVSVSSSRGMDARGTRVKRFTVTTSEGARMTAEGAPLRSAGRRVVR